MGKSQSSQNEQQECLSPGRRIPRASQSSVLALAYAVQDGTFSTSLLSFEVTEKDRWAAVMGINHTR